MHCVCNLTRWVKHTNNAAPHCAPCRLLCWCRSLQMAALCHVPKALQEATPSFSIKEWAEAVAKAGSAEVSDQERPRNAIGTLRAVLHQQALVLPAVVTPPSHAITNAPARHRYLACEAHPSTPCLTRPCLRATYLPTPSHTHRSQRPLRR